ncbi:Pfam:DUF2260 [Aspergillus sp. HF37]|nr:Pfam:DUF2260 [Aspergillus sp. HF37]
MGSMFDGCEIYDIRHDTKSTGLQQEVIQGLSADPLSLPSLLLWDDRGQELFDSFSQTPSYYPFHSELEIINKRSADIARSVPDKSALIELGCGTVRKTRPILAALNQQQKHIHYYALDVSLQGLTDSIDSLVNAMNGSAFIQITGLLGTYDDCIAWLASAGSTRGLYSATFLWMGNSIANFEHVSQPSAILSRFRGACSQSRLGCQFLVSTDACQSESKIAKSYSPELCELREFIMNGLRHANSALGCDLFTYDDWTFGTTVAPDGYGGKSLAVYYAPRRDISVPVNGGLDISFRKGQMIKVISSGKWTRALVEQLGSHAGLQVQHRWMDPSRIYCIYSLAPGVSD